MNSFHVTVRVPPEILSIVCSHLTTEEDVFSASQVCHHWRTVLVSSPSLWTKFSCYRVSRTIAGLERCKHLPIQLEFDRQLSNVALEAILLRENKISISSLAIHRSADRIPSFHQLLVLSRPSVERLHAYSDVTAAWRVEDYAAREAWQDFPSLRELLVSRYSIPIDRLTAQNLAHLALEETEHYQIPTAQSTLDMLRGFPLLETLFIIHTGVRQKPTYNCSPVSLPHLRSIELGLYEVHSELITHLQLPPNVAAGFRMLFSTDVSGDSSPEFVTAAQHVLRRINIRCITLAVPLRSRGGGELLVRFEGLQGSLEMTIFGANAGLWDVFFGPRGVLFSHSPRIENVMELHIIGCSFEGDFVMDHLSASIPNVVSISFFHCDGHHVFGLLTPTNPLSPPFPHLERVMVLGSESELIGMAKTRRDHGVPLKTLVVGRLPEGFGDDSEDSAWLEESDCDYLEDYTALEEFVYDLRIGCPTEILEWGTGNEILSVWSTIGVPGPVSPNEKLMLLG